MVDLSDCSDAESLNSDEESLNSDEELQLAFSKGELKDGLNLGLNVPQKLVDDVEGIEQKLEEMKQSLDWIERLDMTNDPVAAPMGAEDTTDTKEDDLVHDDFKRELRFYRQGQATVIACLEKLHKKGIKTKRPEDYFAEMAKSDRHMKKVREKLLEKQKGIEMREKARKLRDLKKFGKKVQTEVILKRHKEKREMLDAVKRFRKGQKDQLDFLDETEDKSGGGGGKAGGGDKKKEMKKKENAAHAPNRKRIFKNKKFGFGGQKKRSKMNTKESTNDPYAFQQKGLKGKPGFNKKNMGSKAKRPGKTKRASMKNRKK